MSSVTFNRFESLSNEIILDIFEYLDGYNLYQAFYGVNSRINSLLKSAQLHISYDLSKTNETIWNTLLSFIDFSQIRILSSYQNTNINKQFLSTAHGNIYTVLLSIMKEEDMNKMLKNFPDDNRIQFLSLRPTLDYSRKGPSIFETLFLNQGHRFTSLVHLSISSNYSSDFPESSVIFPQLRSLSVENCYFSQNIHKFLQKNTPNLRSFKFGGALQHVTPSSIIIPQVKELHIVNRSDVSMMHGILSNFPSLRRLYVDWQYNRQTPVMTGIQWQKLIEFCLPHLKQLTVEFDQDIQQDILQTFYTNEYWLTKKVKGISSIDKRNSRYPLLKKIVIGKEWRFSYFDYM